MFGLKNGCEVAIGGPFFARNGALSTVVEVGSDGLKGLGIVFTLLAAVLLFGSFVSENSVFAVIVSPAELVNALVPLLVRNEGLFSVFAD